MKRSDCLVHLRPFISLGRRRGCSKALARWVAYALWDSQIMASQGKGAPSNSSRRAQVCTPQRTLAPLDFSRLSMEGALLSLTFLGCFSPFRGITSPSSTSCTFLFLLKSRLGSNHTAVIGKGGRGRLGGAWVLGTSLEADPLFLLTSRPFRLVICLKSIPLSSSELVSTQETINLGEWAAKNLSKSALEFESSIGLF